jgi:hypothetical protein
LQAVLQVEDPQAATAQFLQVVAGAVAAAQPPQRTAPGQSQPKDALSVVDSAVSAGPA